MTSPKMKPCPRCDSTANLAVYQYESGWRHVECDKCFYLGPGEGSIKQAIKSHNLAVADTRRTNVAGSPPRDGFSDQQAPLMSTSREELIALADEDRIDAMRLKAFSTNDPGDRQAYFDAASKWFQDRHYRRLAATPKAGVDREVIARTLLRARGADAVASDEGWASSMDHYRSMCAKYPDYTQASSLIHDVLRDADAILALLPSVLGGVDQESIATKQSPSRTEAAATETTDGAIYAAVSRNSTSPQEQEELDALINAKISKAMYGGSPIYYLRSILRQMEGLRDFVGSCEVLTPSIGSEVLADNIDWLDCFLDEHERAVASTTAPTPDNAGLVSGGGR